MRNKSMYQNLITNKTSRAHVNKHLNIIMHSSRFFITTKTHFKDWEWIWTPFVLLPQLLTCLALLMSDHTASRHYWLTQWAGELLFLKVVAPFSAILIVLFNYCLSVFKVMCFCILFDLLPSRFSICSNLVSAIIAWLHGSLFLFHLSHMTLVCPPLITSI